MAQDCGGNGAGVMWSNESINEASQHAWCVLVLFASPHHILVLSSHFISFHCHSYINRLDCAHPRLLIPACDTATHRSVSSSTFHSIIPVCLTTTNSAFNPLAWQTTHYGLRSAASADCSVFYFGLILVHTLLSQRSEDTLYNASPCWRSSEWGTQFL